jgi:hypothetical protein
VGKYGRGMRATDDSIIRRMRFACWINWVANIHSEYAILIAVPRPLLHERVSVLRYMYIVFNFNFCFFVHVDNYAIIIPTKCTSFLLLKAQDITICTFCLCILSPYMFKPAWLIFRGRNVSAWLKLLMIKIALK